MHHQVTPPEDGEINETNCVNTNQATASPERTIVETDRTPIKQEENLDNDGRRNECPYINTQNEHDISKDVISSQETDNKSNDTTPQIMHHQVTPPEDGEINETNCVNTNQATASPERTIVETDRTPIKQEENLDNDGRRNECPCIKTRNEHDIPVKSESVNNESSTDPGNNNTESQHVFAAEGIRIKEEDES